MRRSQVELRSNRGIAVQNDRNCKDAADKSPVKITPRKEPKPVNAMHDVLAQLKHQMASSASAT